MYSNGRNSMDGCIDPRLLGSPIDTLGQAGAWIGGSGNGAYQGAEDNILLDGLNLGDMSNAMNAPAPQPRLGAQYTTNLDNSTIFPLDASMNLAIPQQPLRPEEFDPRSQVPACSPNNFQRPQLQLATAVSNLQPVNPAYQDPAPRSAPAPDILVLGPDMFPAQPPIINAPNLMNPRRRAVSLAAPPQQLTLHRLVSAPPAVPISPDAYLSPLDAFERSDGPYSPMRVLPHAKSAPNTRPPSPAPRGRSSPARGRSRSRSHSRSNSIASSTRRTSSAASSARSSVSGDFGCDVCYKTFPKLANLNHHKRYHKDDSEKQHACDQCEKRFLFKRELDRHKLCVSHRPRSFFCEHCRAGFGRQDHLDRHVETHTRSAGPATPSSVGTPLTVPSTSGPSGQSLRHCVSTGNLQQELPPPKFELPPQVHCMTNFPPLPGQAQPLQSMPYNPFMTDGAALQWAWSGNGF